ncbi:hypothetical protein KIH87_01090 [Paraneptunicella aestuarii]|uniref:hypothetical protein n=1 Tax=Paraneptunicella aestuarii TaxID=2831148 RepID=UPI001E4D29BB|nr:hypothetical protein [Paraneptunicella aestuarii]UAA38997.1 hypothetical protein KIH87_01090 [Paraneptunicella aestuarii]
MKKTLQITGLVTAILFSAGINAAQTDLKLSKPSGSPTPREDAYTVNIGTLADGLFNDIKQMELNIESKLRTEINKINEVKSISYIDVNTDNLSATFTGEASQKVSLTVGSISVKAQAKFDGIDILCPTVKATVSLQNLRPKATYNFYTGALTSLSINYNNNIDLSCSGGILSFPGVSQLVSIFASNYAEAKVDDMVDSGLRQYTDIINMKNLFGVKSILDKPSVATPVAAIEQQLNIDITNTINNLITGMNVYVGVFRNKNGTNAHQIQLSIFQTAPTITSGAGGYYYASAPGASQIDKYAYSSGAWSSSGWTPGILYNGQTIGAIAFNNNYNIPSYMAQKVVTLADCGKACE